MIKLNTDGTYEYKVGQTTNLTEKDILTHAAITYKFLLNIEQNRGIWHRWDQLADMIYKHSTDKTVHFLAHSLKKIYRRHFAE